jgi:hypothetical protein
MRPLRLLPAKLLAFAWGLRAVATARRQLARGGLDALALPPVPDVPREAKGGVETALRLSRGNCLARSAVRQAWYAAHGRPVDLIIGVTRPGGKFQAHAWLESDPASAGEGFEELARRPAGVPER